LTPAVAASASADSELSELAAYFESEPVAYFESELVAYFESELAAYSELARSAVPP
jgi:hypothetical protein